MLIVGTANIFLILNKINSYIDFTREINLTGVTKTLKKLFELFELVEVSVRRKL